MLSTEFWHLASTKPEVAVEQQHWHGKCKWRGDGDVLQVTAMDMISSSIEGRGAPEEHMWENWEGHAVGGGWREGVIDMGGAGRKSDGGRESLRRQTIHLQCPRWLHTNWSSLVHPLIMLKESTRFSPWGWLSCGLGDPCKPLESASTHVLEESQGGGWGQQFATEGRRPISLHVQSRFFGKYVALSLSSFFVFPIQRFKLSLPKSIQHRDKTNTRLAF